MIRNVKIKLICVNVFLALLVSSVSKADTSPCEARNVSRTNAYQSLVSCLNTWTKDIDPSQSSPADQCSLILRNYIQSAKELKVCFGKGKKKSTENLKK